jgi:integrase
MPPELRRILERHLAETGITSGLVFVGASDAMLGALQTIFPRALAVAKITRDVTPHSLRHTYATAMLHTHFEMPDGRLVQRSSHNVAKLLGHKNSKLVDETYGHLLWDAGMMDELSLDHLRDHPSTRHT